MTRLALRSLLLRPRRTALTSLTVLIAVAIPSGALILTDEITAGYRALFIGADGAAQVVVTGRSDPTLARGTPVTIAAARVSALRSVPGVAAADGQIVDRATVVGRDGRPVRSRTGGTLAFSSLPPSDGDLRLAAGTRPVGAGEVALDPVTARAQHLRIGDSVRILTGQPARPFRVTGFVRIGRDDPRGLPFIVFSLRTARALYGKEGRVDRILVTAARGVGAAQLVRRIGRTLPSVLVARTVAADSDAQVRRVLANLGGLRGGLLALAIAAGLAGILLITANLALSAAARTQELALVRVLGGSRAQALRAVVLEVGLIGVAASAAGLAAGLAAALGIRAALSAAGVDLPPAGSVLALRTVLIATLGGTGVTVLAALPAGLRATAGSPLEALGTARGAEAPKLSRGERGPGTVAAVVAAAVALVTGVALLAAGGDSAHARLITGGIGCLLVLAAVLAALPRLVRVLAPAVVLPFSARDPAIGRLARENLVRAPGRSAATAGTLALGAALMLFLAAYTDGIRAASGRAIDRALAADLTIESGDGATPIPAAVASLTAVTPGVVGVTSLKTAPARIGGVRVQLGGIDPTTVASAYRFDWAEGADAVLGSLGLDGALVETETAARLGLRVGDAVTLRTDSGRRQPFTVRGTYRDPALLPGVTVARIAFDGLISQPRLAAIFLRLGPDADAGQAADGLRTALTRFPGVVVRSAGAVKAQVRSRVDRLVVLLYVLLVVTGLLAAVALAATLTLQIEERTRELGLLRALGMTPEQTRRLLRAEAFGTALIGTVCGIVAGLGFAAAVVGVVDQEGVGFSVPWLPLLAVAVAGPITGFAASAVPAARAARLDVLAAIAYE